MQRLHGVRSNIGYPVPERDGTLARPATCPNTVSLIALELATADGMAPFAHSSVDHLGRLGRGPRALVACADFKPPHRTEFAQLRTPLPATARTSASAAPISWEWHRAAAIA